MFLFKREKECICGNENGNGEGMAVDTLWACDTGLACVREERTRDKRAPETRQGKETRDETGRNR